MIAMRNIECPTCGKETAYEDNEFRPFCSERCKLIDFGAWVNEEYAIASSESELTEEELQVIERASQSNEKQG